MRFTPGPWRAGKISTGQWLIHADMGGPGRTVLAQTMLDDHGSQLGANEANAHLIAAAPDLHAACKMLEDDPGLTAGANDVIKFALAKAHGTAPAAAGETGGSQL